MPLQASGSIFDTRQYDIQLKSKHSVDHEYFVNYFNISTIPGISYNFDIVSTLKGPFKRPRFEVQLFSNSFEISDYNIGSVYLKILKNAEGLS